MIPPIIAGIHRLINELACVRMLRGIALDVRVARTKGYTFGDTLRNIYSAGDSPQKTTARTIRIDPFGKFGRFLNVVKLSTLHAPASTIF